MPNLRMTITDLSEREKIVEQVNTTCMHLFDAWCETRNVTALAYLMHCWPLTDSTPKVLRRLGEAMHDLRRYHADQIDDIGIQALHHMTDQIDGLIERTACRGISVKIGA